MSDKKFLVDLGKRLGLSESEAALKKAEEYYRALQSKILLRKLNNSAKAVLCFNLASLHLGLNFDKETALKLCGFRRQVYQNHFNNIEKILELDRPLTVDELCKQQNCSNIKVLAEDIFKKFMLEKNILEDIVHNQYVSAAVYTACKLKKVKINKSAFIAASRLKPSKWKDLETQFSKFAEKNIAVLENETKEEHDDEYLKELNQREEYPSLNKTEYEDEEELDAEDYDVWKERILREANMEIQAALRRQDGK